MTQLFEDEQTDQNGHLWPVYPNEHGCYSCRHCGVGSYSLRASGPCPSTLNDQGNLKNEIDPQR